ncbi:MAG: hypothetical protein M3R41_09635, partial [Pseudomonadota bacterium]|nr:hypothetical protein [Pseudomonadota bacterium]
MTIDDSDDPGAPARAVGRGVARRVLIGIVVLVAIMLAALWIERRPLASGFIDRTLRDKGVAARYRIADLGLGGQRLTNVVIGDPAHPDLVADWIETRTSIGLSGIGLAGVKAGHVRLRARWAGGKVSFGALDRLLPAPSGKPFALPSFFATIPDARIRFETPYGVVGLKLSGTGRLDNGFVGNLAAVADGLTGGGCSTGRMAAALRLRTAASGPSFSGPLRLASATCGAARADG